MTELIVDSFAGGGGASLGITMALGRGPDIAINHDYEAIALHAANHPESLHYCQDVWEVDPEEACQGRPVGLMWLSPDCFPANTMVLTSEGYKPIEQIELGELVLTHKGRWRKVVEVATTTKPVVTIRGHGHPGLRVSEEHPFYIRESKKSECKWVKVCDLQKNYYWSSPTKVESLDIPQVGGRGMFIDNRLLWLAGRYVGDGWTRLTRARAELVITCNKMEANSLREILNSWPRNGSRCGFDELAWTERETSTAYQFSTNHRGLVAWLRDNFGHGALSKGVPGWVLGMAEDLRHSFLSGYISADGYITDNFVECTTISKSLAFSIKILAQSLGYTVCVYNRENSSVIEGRDVNAHPFYRLRWRHNSDERHCQIVHDDMHIWTPIREIDRSTNEVSVFNIGVEEDESYIVEGIVVHNCKHFSKAKGGKPVSKKIRGLAWVAIRWAKAVRPRVIILENVEEFQTWGPLGEDGMPCQARKGRTFKLFVKRLENLGYQVEWRELKACEYGAPTSRKRLFLIARCDGQPIVWPRPTHGPGKLPYVSAASCIDWSIPCPSIFLTKEEGKAIGVKRPLADATLRRIARGMRRYVFESTQPYLVSYYSAKRSGDDRIASLTNPLPTQSTQNRFGVVVPFFVPRYGERPGQSPRIRSVGDPFPAIVPAGNGASLVSAFLAKHYGGHETPGHNLWDPLSTITSQDHHALVVPELVAPGVTDRREQVHAFLVAYYGNEKDGGTLFDPMRTLTSKERFGLVVMEGTTYQVADIGMRMLAPRELYRAQGFPDSYEIDITYEHEGRIRQMTKTAQVRMVGNSVVPVLAKVIVEANVAEQLTLAA